jgi:acyl-coenzyme A thioesterase PaaI-like protein
MAADLATTDPYSDHTLCRVLEATAARAVVEQPMEPEVDNHVKVRHASALYAAAYEAARQLVISALGDLADSVEVRLADSEIGYRAVGLGTLTSTAEPVGEAWETLDEGETELDCLVTTTDPDGKTVTTLSVRWQVLPASGEAPADSRQPTAD